MTDDTGAIAAIIARAWNADTPTDVPVLAAEILTVLRARGWRPPIPRPPVTMAGPPIDEERMHAIADRIRADTFGTDLTSQLDNEDLTR